MELKSKSSKSVSWGLTSDYSFQNYADKYSGKIDVSLREYIKKCVDNFDITMSKQLEYLKKPYIDAFNGGKMLRAILVCLSYEIFSGEFNDKILHPSIAFEIFQTSVLFHDDIIDKGEYRRGKKTIHKILEGIYKSSFRKKQNTIEDSHKSMAMTVCLGDYGFVLTYKLILESDFDDSVKVKALTALGGVVSDTLLGEMLDVELPNPINDKYNIDEDDIIRIATYKTAQYTISGPLTLGAIFAGVGKEEQQKLIEFGNNLGVAFQIHDDIMGVFGEKIGKPTDSDIKENKITLLYYYAKNNCDVKTKKILENLYGNKDVTKEDVATIKKIFVETGALDYAETKRDLYKDTAKKVLETLNISHEMRSVLCDFSEYITTRSK